MSGFTGNGYGGVIDDLVAGRWRDPDSGAAVSVPIESIVIAASLDGVEADLVRRCHAGQSVTVVHDEMTRAALGSRVCANLRAGGLAVEEYVWPDPRCTAAGAAEITAASEGADALIAVGSGTVSDSVKYATYLDGRSYSVFPTSPMNAYTTPTASVSEDGFKRSITCHSAKGVFFDLGVLSGCPQRLVAAAFADVLCRTTAQVDWLLSHLLFGTPYRETPYVLLALDESEMIANAPHLAAGNIDVLAMLTRTAAIMGLGTSFTGTTHCGSMGEHMMSHYIDMFAGDAHPGSSHGEQVGVTTLTMARLQQSILESDAPPRLEATDIPEAALRARHGDDAAAMMIEQTTRKAQGPAQTAALNDRLAEHWDAYAQRLRAAARPWQELRDAMRAAGCPLTAADLGLPEEFYRADVRYARFIRDRYTMLDVAGDAGMLDGFIASRV